MMKKRIVAAAFATALTLSMSVPAFAGQWQQNTTGWWYQNDDGGYPANSWQWIDGKCYYFDSNGYMLANTITPDGYAVDASGAWIVDGVVQTQNTETQAVSQADITIPNVAGTYIGSGITCSITDEGNNNYWVELSGLEKDYLPNYIGNGAFEIPGYIKYTFSGNTLTVQYMTGETYQLVKQ